MNTEYKKDLTKVKNCRKVIEGILENGYLENESLEDLENVISYLEGIIERETE